MTLNNFDEFIDKTDYLQTRLLQVNSCGSARVVKYAVSYTHLSRGTPLMRMPCPTPRSLP